MRTAHLHFGTKIGRNAAVFTLWIFCAAWASTSCGASQKDSAVVRTSADLETHNAQTTPSADDTTPTKAQVTAETSDSTAIAEKKSQKWPEIPAGYVRAEAWPKAIGTRPWRALEAKTGTFLSTKSAGPWTFVFSSAKNSLRSRGVLITFPGDLRPAQMPARIQVRISPTPISISRQAWPSISEVLQSLGVARINAAPGTTIFIRFDEVRRVSLLALRVWGDGGVGQIGMGQVRLVQERATIQNPTVIKIDLVPESHLSLPAGKAGVLGVGDAVSLPHNENP